MQRGESVFLSFCRKSHLYSDFLCISFLTSISSIKCQYFELRMHYGSKCVISYLHFHYLISFINFFLRRLTERYDKLFRNQMNKTTQNDSPENRCNNFNGFAQEIGDKWNRRHSDNLCDTLSLPVLFIWRLLWEYRYWGYSNTSQKRIDTNNKYFKKQIVLCW